MVIAYSCVTAGVIQRLSFASVKTLVKDRFERLETLLL